MKNILKKTIIFLTIKAIQKYRALKKILGLRPDILLFPADLSSLSGSRGDQAMIIATKVQLNHLFKCNAKYSSIVRGHNAIYESKSLEIQPLCIENYSLISEIRKLLSRFDVVVFIGADVLDGYYSAETSNLIWDWADQAINVKCISIITGFSFNDYPSVEVVKKIQTVSKKIVVNLRDPISYNRFIKACPDRQANLTADIAFLLDASDDVEIFHPKSTAWIRHRRNCGDALCGFNINPHLASQLEITGLSVDALIQSSANAITRIIKKHKISFLLLPHDFREESHDEKVLERLLELIDEECKDSIHVVTSQPTAPAIKALVSQLDFVITGRMHLAIAALGNCVPAAGITYQGKFDGLILGHFNLPDSFVITPEYACVEENIFALIEDSYKNYPSYKKMLASVLPKINDLAEQNFAILAK